MLKLSLSAFALFDSFADFDFESAFFPDLEFAGAAAIMGAVVGFFEDGIVGFAVGVSVGAFDGVFALCDPFFDFFADLDLDLALFPGLEFAGAAAIMRAGVGFFEGGIVGFAVGASVGAFDGAGVGDEEGAFDGDGVGTLGCINGDCVTVPQLAERLPSVIPSQEKALQQSFIPEGIAMLLPAFTQALLALHPLFMPAIEPPSSEALLQEFIPRQESEM